MKRFKEELEKLDKDEIVYIGMRHGCGWIMIEKAEMILHNMEKLNEATRKISENLLVTAEKVVESTPEYIKNRKRELSKLRKMKADDYKEHMKRMAKRNGSKFLKDDMTAEDVKKERVQQLTQMIENLKKKYENAKIYTEENRRYLSQYVHLAERKVIDCYKHETDAIGTCFVLEGKERNDQWFYDEKKNI